MTLHQNAFIPIHLFVRQAWGLNRWFRSHNIITDWVFKRNMKTINHLMTFSTIHLRNLQITRLDVGTCRHHWPVIVQGSFQSKSAVGLFNLVWCNAKQCLYYSSSNAGFPLNPTARMWSRQMTLLCLRVNDWDILRQAGLTGMRSKEMRSKDFLL